MVMSLPTDANYSDADMTALVGMQEAFKAQRLGFRNAPFFTIKRRLEALPKIRALILDNGEPIRKSISEDFGHRSAAETELLEIVPVLNALRHTRRNLG